ncbi:MAG: hypothetical protein Q9164_003854 [Protoblastenia rupestris]
MSKRVMSEDLSEFSCCPQVGLQHQFFHLTLRSFRFWMKLWIVKPWIITLWAVRLTPQVGRIFFPVQQIESVGFKDRSDGSAIYQAHLRDQPWDAPEPQSCKTPPQNYNDFRSAADQRTPELRFVKLPSTSTQAQGSLRSKSDAAEESIEVSIPPHPENLFLLLCIPQYKFATKLVHMDVRALDSDRLFFSHLRKNYFNMPGQFAKMLSLRKLMRIKFVQFEAYKSELVDIRKTDDIPPEAKKDEYRYRPIPAEIIPPVGENHLMHLYEHPDHAEETGLCLDRMPKKLRQRLSVCPRRGTSLGWGVHFVEGLHWTKLYALGLTGLLLGVLFGVLWAKLRDDVQGGFGIAACIMLGFTFTVGIVQAAFDST